MMVYMRLKQSIPKSCEPVTISQTADKELLDNAIKQLKSQCPAYAHDIILSYINNTCKTDAEKANKITEINKLAEFLGIYVDSYFSAICWTKAVDKLTDEKIIKFAKSIEPLAAGSYFFTISETEAIAELTDERVLNAVNSIKQIIPDMLQDYLIAIGLTKAVTELTDKRVLAAVNSIKAIDPMLLKQYFLIIGETKAVAELTNVRTLTVVDSLMKVHPAAAQHYLLAIGNTKEIDKLTREEVIKFAKLIGPAAEWYFSALNETGAIAELTDDRVLNTINFIKVIGPAAAKHYFFAIGETKAVNYFTSNRIINENIISLVSSFGLGGSSLFRIPIEQLEKLAAGQIVLSDFLKTAVRNGTVNIASIFRELDSLPQHGGRERTSKCVTALRQASTSRSRRPEYLGSEYLNAMLGITKNEQYEKAIKWLKGNRRDLYEKVMGISDELKRLSEESAPDCMVNVGYKVIFPDELYEIIRHRFIPSIDEHTLFLQGLASSFMAASHYAFSLDEAFKGISKEIQKPNPDNREIEKLVDSMELVIKQQQGLVFDAPPLHGGARGEEPPTWDPRGFKATRNTFQVVFVEELVPKAIGWKDDWGGEKRRTVKADASPTQAWVFNEVSRHHVDISRKRLFINSCEYYINGNKRKFKMRIHQLSDSPKEVSLGNEGIAVELELNGHKQFLDGYQFSKLAKMLEKRTVASLLFDGELDKLHHV